MSYCDDKKLVAILTKEAQDEIEINLVAGIENIIDTPYNNSENLKNQLKEAKTYTDKKFLKEKIKQEKERYKSHLKLYNHLVDTSKQLLYDANPFVLPSEFVENQLNWVQGIFQEAFGQPSYSAKQKGIEVSGLNNPNLWDSGKINAILHLIKTREKQASKLAKQISPTYDTIVKPLIVAASADRTGSALKLVRQTNELLDVYQQRGYPWKMSIIDPNTRQKNPISLQTINDKLAQVGARGDVEGLSDLQTSPAVSQLSEELLHDEVRNIIPKDIPTNPENFTKWRNSWGGKKFFEMIKFESERHDIGDGDSKYVMIPLHSEELGYNWLRKQRKNQIEKGEISIDPGEKENAFLVYRIPDNLDDFFKSIKKNKLITEDSLKEHLLPSELEEGFFTAQEHKVYKYEYIPNTIKPKRKYANWSKGVNYNNNIYEPSDGWMPELWESIDMQREWNDLFFEKVLKEGHQETLQELQRYLNEITPRLLEFDWSMEDIQELLDKVMDMGGMNFNLFQDKDGNWLSPNSHVRKVKYGYGYTQFEKPVNDAMMAETADVITKSYLPEIEAQLITDQNILESEDSNEGEIAESMERVAEFEDKKLYYESMLEHIDRVLYGDNETDSDKREMMLASRILATEGRTLFTDHKRRRKDKGIWNELVDQAFRADELTKVKLQLLKTTLALSHNPSLVNYLVDHVRAASGHADIEAGFLKLSYGDKQVADMFGDDITAEKIRDGGLIIRGYMTAANLGWGTSLTNNFQRISSVINNGLERTLYAMHAVRHGDDKGFSPEKIRQMVEETGVLHPGNAFIDMLTMGIDFAVGSEYKEFILPVADLTRLWKATSLPDFLNNSKNWDKLISSAEGRGARGEKLQYEELKRIKTGLYQVIHGEYKNNAEDRKKLKNRLSNLRLGLTLSHINRLVKWKLQWFPFGTNLLTMSGSEEQMRLEHAYQGMRFVYDMGRIDAPTTGDWKYTDSSEAIDAARLFVYYNLFGFTKVMNPKMFRGMVGGTGLQWKQYDYNEIALEYEIFRAAAFSPKYTQDSPLIAASMLGPRLMMQIAKKVLRGGSQAARLFGFSKQQVEYWTKFININKELDDKALDRAATLMMTRGLSSLISEIMYYSFAPYSFLRSVSSKINRLVGRNKLNQRALFGTASPLISKAIRVAVALMVFGKIISRGYDEDEDPWYIQAARDLPFSAHLTSTLLFLHDWNKNAIRSARPYLLSPFKEVSQAVDSFRD